MFKKVASLFLIIFLLFFTIPLYAAEDIDRPVDYVRSNDTRYELSQNYIKNNFKEERISKKSMQYVRSGDNTIDIKLSKNEKDAISCGQEQVLKIEFNQKIDQKTATNANVYLENTINSHKTVNQVQLDSDDNSIIYVYPPTGGYTLGQRFTLVITTALQSITGKSLKENYYKPINITNISIKPTNVIATAISNTEITLQWDKVEDADYYYVYTSNSANGEYYKLYHDNEDYKWYWNEDYSLITSELQSNTTVYYKVAAVVDGVESEFSEVAYATTLNKEKPQAPTILKAWDVSSDKIKLYWDEVEDADYYYVYESDSYHGPFTTWYDKNGEKFKAYWHEDYCVSEYEISPNTTIYYKVTAVKDGVESEFSRVVSATTSGGNIVSVPRNIRAWAVSSDVIKVNWDKVEDADYYYVYYSDSPIGPFDSFSDIHTGEQYKFDWYSDYSLYDNQVSPNETWYYKVTAVKNGIESASSMVVSATTFNKYTVPAPERLKAWAISDNEIKLYWNEVEDADYYYVYESDLYDGPYTAWLSENGEKFKAYWNEDYCIREYGINPNTTEYFKVTAVKDSEESEYSNIAYATTFDDTSSTYRALLIGNSNYSEKPLNGPPLDIEKMDQVLSDSYFGINDTQFSKIEVKEDLTKDEILKAIKDTFAGANENDISYFYFSGHGTKNYYGESALVGIETQEGDYYINTYELKSALDDIPGTIVVILDCCYSGGFIDRNLMANDEEDATNESQKIAEENNESVKIAEDNIEAFNNNFIEVFSENEKMNNMSITKHLNTSKYKVLTASAGYETSVENPYIGGEFTYYFTQGSGYNDRSMLPADSNIDNKVSLQEIYEYTYNNVSNSHVQVYPNYDAFEIIGKEKSTNKSIEMNDKEPQAIENNSN